MQSFLRSVSKSIFIGALFIALFVGHSVQAGSVTAPTNIHTVTLGDTTATIAWNPSTSSTGGAITYTVVSVYDSKPIGTTQSTNYSLIGLNPGTPYSIIINAQDTSLSSATGGPYLLWTTGTAPTGTTTTTTPTNTQDGGYQFNVHFINPLGSDGPQDIPSLFNKILDALMLFLVPVVVVLIIYSGFLFVMAQGNTEKLKTAKATLLWTLVGAAILLGAKVIASILSTTVTNILQ